LDHFYHNYPEIQAGNLVLFYKKDEKQSLKLIQRPVTGNHYQIISTDYKEYFIYISRS